MEYVRFGKTGMKVSRLCLGCMTYGSTKWRDWVLEEEASRPFIKEALESGINFFDTANIYNAGASETILGQILKGRRDKVILASKVAAKMGPGAVSMSFGSAEAGWAPSVDSYFAAAGMTYIAAAGDSGSQPSPPIGWSLSQSAERSSDPPRRLPAPSQAWRFDSRRAPDLYKVA